MKATTTTMAIDNDNNDKDDNDKDDNENAAALPHPLPPLVPRRNTTRRRTLR